MGNTSFEIMLVGAFWRSRYHGGDDPVVVMQDCSFGFLRLTRLRHLHARGRQNPLLAAQEASISTGVYAWPGVWRSGLESVTKCWHPASHPISVRNPQHQG